MQFIYPINLSQIIYISLMYGSASMFYVRKCREPANWFYISDVQAPGSCVYFSSVNKLGVLCFPILTYSTLLRSSHCIFVAVRSISSSHQRKPTQNKDASEISSSKYLLYLGIVHLASSIP